MGSLRLGNYVTLKASIAQGIDRGEIPERSQGEAGKSATLTLGTYGYLFPDCLDEVSKKMHKRRSKQLAKAKAKLEKTERKAREAAEAVAALRRTSRDACPIRAGEP